jgi:protoheme IX farnesyltransferase
VLIALALAFSGLLILFMAHHCTSAVLALVAVGWYNAVYTPLKRWTAVAVIPGALVGAIPPAMGWAASGGSLRDPALLALCAVYFLWQVPHFWLLMFIHQDDYERAGYPTLAAHPRRSLVFVLFAWISSAILSVCLLPFMGTVRSPWIIGVMGVAALWMLLQACRIFVANADEKLFWRLFVSLNGFVFLVTLGVGIDALIR